MEVEIPTGKLTKSDFLEHVDAILAPRGFERKGQRFSRRPEGYVRVQVVDFMGAGGGFGQFILAPYLILKGKAVRGTAALRKHVLGALVADYGMRMGIERANYISYYDNWFSEPEWLDLFDGVLEGVLSGLEPLMRDEASLQAFIDKTYRSSTVVSISANKHKTDIGE